MMIFALQGSPRPQGNTQTVLEMVLAGAAEAGAQTDLVQISEIEVRSGCLECFSCQQVPDEPGCVVEDQIQDVIGKMLAADVIVLATPVFCFSPAWHLKMAMDRFFCLFKIDGPDGYRTLLEGRKMAAVITAGGGENDGADLVQEVCRRLAEFSRTDWLGAFVATKVKDPASIRADEALCQRAREFGRQLLP